MSDETKNLLWLALLGGAAYWLYKVFYSPSGAVSSAEQSIADAFVNLTHTAAQGTSQLVFPDGSTLPVAAMENGTKRWSGNNLLFDLNGTTYSVSARDASGNYPATPLNGLMGYPRRRRVRYA